MRIALAAGLLMSIGCGTPHVVLTIVDESGQADAAESIALLGDDGWQRERGRRAHVFPLTVTLTADEPGLSRTLWVEARLEDGRAVARGRTTLVFPAMGAGEATVSLWHACEHPLAGVRPCAFDTPVGATGICVAGTCATSKCGDGVVDPSNPEVSEACDDGNARDDDACLSDCQRAHCGDGITRSDITDPDDPLFEACDDGEANDSGLQCSPLCRLNTCGDGIRRVDVLVPNEPGYEECDEEDNNRDTGRCTTTCLFNVCGDGLVLSTGDPGVDEVCDDGNVADGDGCRGDCRKLEVCGDGVIDAGEECDDGPGDLPNDGCFACARERWKPTVVVGLGEAQGIAKQALLTNPGSMTIDGDGIVYVALPTGHRVYRYDPRAEAADGSLGVLSLFAGTGRPGNSGDRGPARFAQLNGPTALAADQLGNLYIADSNNRAVRVVRSDGIINTLEIGSVLAVEGLAVGRFGDLLIAGNKIYRVALEDGVAAANAEELSPGLLAADRVGLTPTGQILYSSGGLLYSLDGGSSVRLAGGSRCQPADGCGDGGPLKDAGFSDISALVYGVDGVFVADRGIPRIRRIALNPVTRTIDADSVISRFAGQSEFCDAVATPACGDGGEALAAQLHQVLGLAVSLSGELYLSDHTLNRVRRIDDADPDAPGPQPGIISTVVGTGQPEGLPPTRPLWSRLSNIAHVAADPASPDLFYLYGTSVPVIRGVDRATDIMMVVAGTSLACSAQSDDGCGDGGEALSARLGLVHDLAVGTDGWVYFIEANQLRRFDPQSGGIIETIARNVQPAGLNIQQLKGLSFDTTTGSLYLTDFAGGRVYEVSVDGTGRIPSPATFVHFAGTPCPGGCDPSQQLPVEADRLDFWVGSPGPIVRDSTNGYTYFIDEDWDAVIQIRAEPRGVTDLFFSCWAMPECGAMRDVAIGPNGSVVLVDDDEVLEITSPSQATTLIAGQGETSGDRGPASAASARGPNSVALTVDGRLLLGQGDGYVRILHDAAGTLMIDSAVGPYFPFDGQPDGSFGLAELGQPRRLTQLTTAAGSPWMISDAVPGQLRLVSSSTWTVQTVGGHPFPDPRPADPTTPSTLALFRFLSAPTGIAWDDARDTLWVTEQRAHALMTIDATGATSAWTIALAAGALDTPGHLNASASAARFNYPAGLSIGGNHLYVADRGNHVVRRIDLSAGTTQTVVGTPETEGIFAEDGARAGDVYLRSPTGLLAVAGGLYVADTYNNRVLFVEDTDADGVSSNDPVWVVLGRDREPSSLGDNLPAAELPVDSPEGLAIDSQGNLFVASKTAVRLVPAGGDVALGDDIALTIFGGASHQQFAERTIRCLSDLAVTDGDRGMLEDRIVVLDACQGLLLHLDRQ